MVGLTSYAAGILYYALLWMNDSNYVTLMAIAALMALMAIYVFTFPKYSTEQVTTAFFGIFYSVSYTHLDVYKRQTISCF